MAVVHRLLARVRSADPYRFDLGLAAVGVVAMVVESALIDVQSGDRATTAVVGVLMVGCAVGLRRRNTVLAAVLFVAIALAQTPLDTFIFEHSTTPFVALLVLLYSAGRYVTGRRLQLALAVLFPGTVAAISIDSGQGLEDVIWAALLFTPPVLAGRALRNRARLQAELREQVERAEAGREARAAAAAQEERERIASELQALVANGVSAMVVQAEAVPHVLAAGNTAAARDSFAVIEETGRDALAEMRRLLGVLRREGEDPALAPQPGLARLDPLAARVREQGLDLEVRVEGERRGLTPGLDLTAFRLLQESLDAAVAGGAAAATVTLRYGERDLELELRDSGAAEPGAGFPLAALRERVGLYGGHIRIERRGGFSVEARLPLERDAAAAGSPA